MMLSFQKDHTEANTDINDDKYEIPMLKYVTEILELVS